MDAKELQVRIDKKKADIAKIEKRIDKWEKARSDEAFIKDTASYISQDPKSIKTIDDLIAARQALDPTGNAERWVNYTHENYLKDIESELRRANNDLNDANATLEKYENSLAAVEEKNAQPKLQIFVDFLNAWKQDMVEYITENIKVKDEYYQVNSAATKLRNDAWQVRRGLIDKDEFEKQLEETEYREKQLKAAIHPITDIVYSRRNEDHIDHEELEKILDKECESKYWNMIAKTQEITGNITDASGLRIGPDGNINGIIIGDKGKARLETIYAGGYNQDVIVNTRHGQRLHFRLLVHPIK